MLVDKHLNSFLLAHCAIQTVIPHVVRKICKSGCRHNVRLAIPTVGVEPAVAITSG